MSFNPLNELKRRLEDDETPLPKRLCLAKNLVASHHFPTAAKERLVAEWLNSLTEKRKLSSEDLRNVIGWLSAVDDLTSELKANLVHIVSKYLQTNPIQKGDVQCVLTLLEDYKMSTQLSSQVNDYLLITITLLQYLRSDENLNLILIERIFKNMIKYYRDSKKKFEFIAKLLDGENIETVFSYLDTDVRNAVISVCEVILFPLNKRSFYITLLKTYIWKDNIKELIDEKGDNIQSVLKIMDTFFLFPKGRTNNDPNFLRDFIDVFVSCHPKESQQIFAFYIMVVNTLDMEQNYFIPTTNITAIDLGVNHEKVKRNLFFNMLKVLLLNEVDVSVRLTDTLGEKISKVEIKKTFLLFIQAVMMKQLKLEGKPDKTTIKIINTALKLDPTLIEPKINDILPPIMTAKKNSLNIKESYIEMLNCLLEILFKLSRGITFLNQILPTLKHNLETSNTEQLELKQKLKECTDSGKDGDKILNKIITEDDIFPQECIETYGKLTSELMFRQNKELLLMFREDMEKHCLYVLEQGVIDPSTIILTEVISAILCSFLQHSKMADHTVPINISEEFWSLYQNFENDILKRFGECVLKSNCEPSLLLSFLKLCLSFSQLKLLNINYGNTKVELLEIGNTDVFDLSFLLPCLDGEQWIQLASTDNCDEVMVIWDKLILTKIKAVEVLRVLRDRTETQNEDVITGKSYLIKQLSSNPHVETNNFLSQILFVNLDKNQLKTLSKYLVKSHLDNPEANIFKNDIIYNNRELLNALLIETTKNICKCLQNTETLTKCLSKSDFDIASFAKETDMKNYFEEISGTDDNSTVANCVEILKELQIYYLEEKYQLLAIFVLLVLKKCSQKKMRRNIDHILQSIFELSNQSPDLYKIFPINYIFSFEDKTLLNLLTLKIKTSNNLLVIKSITESAVKRVKMETDLIKNIVALLLKKNEENRKSVASKEYFSDTAFQISCIILPLIAKQRKVITASAYRSILADLQEKIHISMLKSFKNIDFKENSSLFNLSTGNIEDSMIVSESTTATLNAMAAYSLTLSKYCETTDAEEIKNLDCLWSGMEFFVQSALLAIQNPKSKTQHIDSSLQLLNIVLRYIKKLDTHYIFEAKDKLFVQIWQSVKSRLFMVYEKQDGANKGCLDDLAVTLKFLCEHSSIECFVNQFVVDLNSLTVLEKPQTKLKEEELNKCLTSHKVSKYLWTNCLKANIVGPKCVAMSKAMYQACKNAKNFIWQHYESEQYGVVIKSKKKKVFIDIQDNNESVKTVKIDDHVCELLKLFLDSLSETIFAGKKISLDYKFLDSIFAVQNVLHTILGLTNLQISCDVSWRGFFMLFQGSMSVLNCLLLWREELLEDRWPCYMQNYRSLIHCLCERIVQASSERIVEEKLAEIAHSIEKLTQQISKRKIHISRIAAYSVADICSVIERTAPPRILRQHLENSVSLLIQASDTSYAVAFLRRALAGVPGQMTMTNLYTMYKRYHKYVGNS